MFFTFENLFLCLITFFSCINLRVRLCAYWKKTKILILKLKKIRFTHFVIAGKGNDVPFISLPHQTE